ncbi:hypothetical protein U1Q18_040748 [Sarracenia purpurea var. burkii]
MKKKSLESEVKVYSTCPDSLLSVKSAIEARIRKLKGLSQEKLNSDLVKEVRAAPAGFSENEEVEASNGEISSDCDDGRSPAFSDGRRRDPFVWSDEG